MSTTPFGLRQSVEIEILSPDTMNTIVDLVLPNGESYAQPVGLFIDNEFVPSKSGKVFETIDPRCVLGPAPNTYHKLMKGQHREENRGRL
jgi:hypothetical protein